MQFLLRLALLIAICLGVTSGLANKAWTQVFPNKPIRFLVPFPAGGSTDAVARAMQPALEKILGQPVVVENRPGAGGMLGVDAVRRPHPMVIQSGSPARAHWESTSASG